MKRLLLLISLLITSCDFLKNYDYKDINESHFIMWQNIFNYTESGYFYIFSYTCPNCEEIKNDILCFLLKQEHYYLVSKDNDINYCRDENISIGKEDIDNLCIRGFPTLLFMDKYKITSIYTGKRNILDFIKNSSI